MRIPLLKNSAILKNSIWGVASSIVSNVLLSLFFVFLARSYSTYDFAQFLIANTLYQIITAFSALGLGQWFVREHISTDDKEKLTARFIKMQFCFGVVFYLLCIGMVYAIYDDPLIEKLTIILGVNIILDNVIYAIKNLNAAQFQQKKTFIILLIDSVVRFLVGFALLLYPFSVVTLSLLVILTRFFTLNLFIKIGVSKDVSLRTILFSSIEWKEVRSIIGSNWPFIVIGSISIIYWRIGSVAISKILSAADVANYEISFKVFTLAQIIPLILSATVFPSLVKKYEEGSLTDFLLFYRKMFLIYLAFGLLSFTFIYSFSDLIITYAFGTSYEGTFIYTRQMFFTMILFPTAYLQANVLVAMKLEKSDMWLNVVSFITYLSVALIWINFNKSLGVINYSILISFIIFHLLQDRILIAKKITSLKHVFSFYMIIIAVTGVYMAAFEATHSYATFFVFWGLIAAVVLSRKDIHAALAIDNSGV
jgi:O-antigen/teichoic acid export membrane protein